VRLRRDPLHDVVERRWHDPTRCHPRRRVLDDAAAGRGRRHAVDAEDPVHLRAAQRLLAGTTLLRPAATPRHPKWPSRPPPSSCLLQAIDAVAASPPGRCRRTVGGRGPAAVPHRPLPPRALAVNPGSSSRSPSYPSATPSPARLHLPTPWPFTVAPPLWTRFVFLMTSGILTVQCHLRATTGYV
jgi:hypothetical protein